MRSLKSKETSFKSEMIECCSKWKAIWIVFRNKCSFWSSSNLLKKATSSKCSITSNNADNSKYKKSRIKKTLKQKYKKTFLSLKWETSHTNYFHLHTLRQTPAHYRNLKSTNTSCTLPSFIQSPSLHSAKSIIKTSTLTKSNKKAELFPTTTLLCRSPKPIVRLINWGVLWNHPTGKTLFRIKSW